MYCTAYGKAIAMIDLSASVSIYRPIQKVFEFLSRTENDFQWQYGTLESARISSDAVGVGVFFRSIGHVMGRRLLATFEITEYEANKAISMFNAYSLDGHELKVNVAKPKVAHS